MKTIEERESDEYLAEIFISRINLYQLTNTELFAPSDAGMKHARNYLAGEFVRRKAIEELTQMAENNGEYGKKWIVLNGVFEEGYEKYLDNNYLATWALAEIANRIL